MPWRLSLRDSSKKETQQGQKEVGEMWQT